jgi:glycosyltransferase involved in cell wall biosynthesis
LSQPITKQTFNHQLKILKILWFCNTPSLAEAVLNNKPTSGGWIKTLDKYLQNKVSLHVAFHHHDELEPFFHGKTWYYPVFTPYSLVQKLQNRFWRIRVVDEQYKNKYLQIIETVQPDLIHIHGTENSFGCIHAQTNIPVLLSVQGIVNSLVDKIEQAPREMQKLHAYKKEKDRFVRMARLEEKYLKEVRFIHSKSDWSSRVMQVLSPEAKCWRVDNVMRDSFYSLEWNPKMLEQKQLVISTTLSDGVLKGLDVIGRTAAILALTDLDFEWNIVGIGPDSEIFRFTQQQFGKCWPENRIFPRGRMKEEQLAELLLRSSLYVTCSRMENSPNNLNEALILGLPTIASFVGGTSTFIKDGFTGLLVQEGDSYGFAGAIRYLHSHKDEALTLGNNARIEALKRHNKDKVCNDMLKVYQDILN